jgi:hypothetical protein
VGKETTIADAVRLETCKYREAAKNPAAIHRAACLLSAVDISAAFISADCHRISRSVLSTGSKPSGSGITSLDLIQS